MELFQVHICVQFEWKSKFLVWCRASSVMNFADDSIVAVILPFSKDSTFCEIQQHFLVQVRVRIDLKMLGVRNTVMHMR